MVRQIQFFAGGLNLWLCTAFHSILDHVWIWWLCGLPFTLTDSHSLYSMSFQFVLSFSNPLPATRNCANDGFIYFYCLRILC